SPTCGAANPTPLASYIVSNIFAMTSASSGSLKFVTGSVSRSSTGSPYFTILYVILELLHLVQVAFEVPLGFRQRIAAELFQKRLRQYDRHHRFADDSRRRRHTNVATFVRRRACLPRLQVHRLQRTP